MPKLVSLYNHGPREINAAPIRGDIKITLLARQQKEYPEDLAKEILARYDFLEVRGEREVPDDNVSIAPTVPPADPVVVGAEVPEQVVPREEPKEEPAEEKKEDEAFDDSNNALCAICEKEFKNVAGYRIHLKKAHNA